jgi:hypothetical protein
MTLLIVEGSISLTATLNIFSTWRPNVRVQDDVQFNTALYDTRSTAHIVVAEVQLHARSTPISTPGCLRNKAANSSGMSYTTLESRFIMAPRFSNSLLSLCVAADRLQS